MKKTIRMLSIGAASLLAASVAGSVFGEASDPDAYGDGYQSGAYGRVRSADAGATLVRADGASDDSDRVSVNAPVFPGDTLRTDASQRVEVQLAGGTTVRVDRGGEVVFQSLPSPSAKYQDNTVLVLGHGAMRVTSRLGDKEEFRIDTRDASVYLLGDGDFRIEADDRGGTRVASLRGVAEVVGNDTSVLVRGGTRTTAYTGAAPEEPRAFSAFASDGFDRWCEARDDAGRGHDRNASRDDQTTDVPDEVQPYYSELSASGRFANDPDYGTVWYPSGVSSGWRPYSDGYWSYGPGGYFWVSSEPWGWAPYHYGNWQWTLSGWCWVPGHVFAGAWVSWSWGSLYVGWAPLDYWGRPGWLGGPYYGGYYDPGCWTFVNYGHFGHSHLGRYAVPIGTVRDDLRHATVVSRPPQIDPRRIAESPQWKDRALKQVGDDREARVSPIDSGRRPTQRLSDVQDHLMRRAPQAAATARPSRETIGTPGLDRRVITPKPRRILEDTRPSLRLNDRVGTRDDVRELYQRMSRPRETRAPETTGRAQDAPVYRPRTDVSREPARRQEAPHPEFQRPQAQQQRSQAQAPQPQRQQPQAQRPQQQRPQQQRAQQQRPQQQRPQQQRPQPSGGERPKHGDKH